MIAMPPALTVLIESPVSVENLRHEPTVGKRLMEGKSPAKPERRLVWLESARQTVCPARGLTDADMRRDWPAEKTLMISLSFLPSVVQNAVVLRGGGRKGSRGVVAEGLRREFLFGEGKVRI